MLDNLEALLASDDRTGSYLPGYEGYGRLAESAHLSCVLLTSREKPKEIGPLEGVRSPVRSLRLAGLDEQAAQELLIDKGLSGTPIAWQRLVTNYAGNPLALKIVAQVILDLFSGDLDRFLHRGCDHSGLWSRQRHQPSQSPAWPLARLGILIGVVALIWPAVTVYMFLFLLAAWAMIGGILQLVAPLLFPMSVGRGFLMIVGGIVSIVLGILIAARPASGLLTLAWLIGIYAIVIGVMYTATNFQARSLQVGLA